VVISAVEHSSVIGPAEALLDAGWRLDLAGVDANGLIDSTRFRELLTPQTAVASVILGNHDTGVLQPIAELAGICNELGVQLHTDAVQAIGKVPVDFRALGVAALSGAAHKFCGPLGIGLLLLRHDVFLEPLFYGGSQQGGVRPGTESVPLVLGLLAALRIWRDQPQQHLAQLQQLRERFETGVRAGCPMAVVHAANVGRLPNTSNIGFPGIDGQILLLALDMAGVACSVGSACSSGSSELSPTLRAMGLPRELVASSLRFSFGATTTEAEIDEAVRRVVHVCQELA
jgi:cysteine desulfurase